LSRASLLGGAPLILGAGSSSLRKKSAAIALTGVDK
jgi:hypothetical protein